MIYFKNKRLELIARILPWKVDDCAPGKLWFIFFVKATNPKGNPQAKDLPKINISGFIL